MKLFIFFFLINFILFQLKMLLFENFLRVTKNIKKNYLFN